MNFRRIVGGIGLAALLSLLSSVASAQVGTNGGIVGSIHDLSAAAGAQTTETCVFCHTPHGSDTSAAVPLWNKALPDGASYTKYSTLGTSTLDGTEAAAVGSVSLACLSCHDGVQAVDSVLNTPGRGMGANYPAGTAIGTTGSMTGTPVPVLGADLTDDHPISIQYGGGGLNDTQAIGDNAAVALGDGDFNAPYSADINSNRVWWVDTGATTGTREKTDMILYSRDDLTTGQFEPFVECGSCHDPHNSSTYQANQQVSFLRIDNTASAVCTACHIK